ncbi:hypothetical protein A3H16_00085 [Candidatus Kaiserbacteria bacterium RIFCSPLOWO2_12_FULL_53_8]|uniref:DUF2157 domain-containing protein n=2 Tax=Candidatus Kaiseribacteriota TaxID=1752734 RepID=A0A1F6CU57_9BACT|nr:MAG: hypothetical protein A2851_01555 [Candidatus Kaiserbacteria bacterium RIFCSPHIGHO2_01_FULL_53_29]OGG92281.1 MAG: hypothetical protein A3H16_00085 [Candidatus Kaiserbacteria bacterium RIFCSPLOWO2_12_FULL_53_8]
MDESNQAIKLQLLGAVRLGLQAGTITKEELAALMGMSASTQLSQQTTAPLEQPERISVVQLLQYMGGFIVLLGIGAFVATFWEDISPMARVVIAAGGTLLAYVLGVALMRVDTKSQSGVAFHLIAGCLFPFAFYVALNELFMLEMTAETVAVISLVLLVIYAASFAVFRHLIFTFFMLANSISFIYSGIYVLMPDISWEMLAHLTLVIGAIGIFVGYSFRGTENERLSELMYFLGGLAVLISPATVFESTPIWQLVYPFLIAFMLYLAMLLHSKRILMISVLAVMGYVIYLTGKYFADVVGWPIALVATGILLIVIGYVAVKYKEKI